MSEQVTAHYSFGGLRDRIEAGLAATDEAATVETLGAVDEFHVGGRRATAHLVAQLELSTSDHVLDIGCGLGGMARYIASQTSARVTGVDLTAEYVEVAGWLTELVDLGDLISFVHGSATDLPATAGPFTAATMVHVGMNIVDKPAVFEQVAAAMAAGSPFAIYDVLLTGEAQPNFPTPWAATADTSVLESADAYVGHLERAGFVIETVNDRTDAALASFDQLAASAGSGPPPLGLHLVMGPTTPTKIGNLVAAIKAGVLAPTEIVARTLN